MVLVSIVIANLFEKTAYFINQVADGQFDPFNEHRECFEFYIYLIQGCTIHIIHTFCFKSNFYKLASTFRFSSGGHFEKWLPFASGRDFSVAPYLKFLGLTRGRRMPNFMLVAKSARSMSESAWL